MLVCQGELAGGSAIGAALNVAPLPVMSIGVIDCRAMTSMNELSTDEPAPIIKTDRIGRSHYRDDFKAEVLAAFEESSVSGQAFAEQCGVKYPTFGPPRGKDLTAQLLWT